MPKSNPIQLARLLVSLYTIMEGLHPGCLCSMHHQSIMCNDDHVCGDCDLVLFVQDGKVCGELIGL